MMKTHNGAPQYEHSLSHALEFFGKAGSLFTKKGSFYGGEDTALSLFQKTWIVDELLSFKLLLWLRDCRGGAGNRSGFRACLAWLGDNAPEWIKANVGYIPEVGRWDDLAALYETKAEKAALDWWAMGIRAQHGLACKWADRNDEKLARNMDLTARSFRKLLVAGTQVVETQMCKKQWPVIDYTKVPSVAMARYTNAFKKHDTERFNTFKNVALAVAQNAPEVVTKVIKTEALFPHDCLRTARNGDPVVAEAQFLGLPDYLGDSKQKIMAIVDASASMSAPISKDGKANGVTIGDVALAIGLYVSDRLGKANPLYRRFMEFCSESQLVDWSKCAFADVGRLLKGNVGSTNIAHALDTIRKIGQIRDIHPGNMPNVLLVLSDMQFDKGGSSTDMTVIEERLNEWPKYGYKKPKVIYWNLAGYQGSPATKSTPNVALVSGFNPATFKAVLGGTDFSPVGVMNRALEKYKPVVPGFTLKTGGKGIDID